MNEKKGNWGKKAMFIGIPAVLLLIFLRFILFYFKSDGFSGLSLFLPLSAAGILIFMLLSSAFFAAWVYQDCGKRNDDGILWAIIIFITTPFIGLLIYFLRRPEAKQTCHSCGRLISVNANYCENCGFSIESKEVNFMNKSTHHITYIIAGVICMVLTLASLTGFIVTAAVRGNINDSTTSNERVWNSGVIFMSVETHFNNKWKLSFKSASEGYVKESNLNISDSESESLYADINCETIPEGSSLTLWLVQDDVTESFDVTNLSEPLEYSLSGFENGKIHVRLEINGVEGVASEITIE